MVGSAAEEAFGSSHSPPNLKLKVLLSSGDGNKRPALGQMGVADPHFFVS
jgi:hypothetical protein